MSDQRVVIAPIVAPAAERRALILKAERRGFHRIALDEGADADELGGGTTVIRRSRSGSFGAEDGGEVPLFSVDQPLDAAPVVARLKGGQPVAVRWLRERVIPLENLVAARVRPGTLWVVTDRPADVPGFLGALEHGADVVVVEVSAPSQLDELEGLLEHADFPLSWERLRVSRVATAGLGDRVIVDTTSLLQPDEGLLVGSAAAVLLHVASEAVGSRYTRPRPFRVNAGAAHLYTLLANGETRYLSELVAGDAVLATRPEGRARAVRVGRIKIERRPLALVEVERGSRTYTAFLQEAETVRLTTTDGRVATTELRPGAQVWAVSLPSARHLGAAVSETIEER